MKPEHPRLREIEAARNELLAQVKKLDDERKRVLISQLDIKVGDVVRDLRDSREMLVVEIDHPEWKWVIASPKREDGTWSKNRRRLFDRWEKVK